MATYESNSSKYLNKFHRDHAYYDLLNIAIHHFKEAYCIKNFVRLRKIPFHDTKKLEKNYASSGDFAKEAIIDNVKITTCFENYLKGLLIYKGYIIHKIDRKIKNKKFAALSNDPRERPIRISQLKKIENYRKNPNTGNLKLFGLKESTIGFNGILNSNDYKKLHKLPTNIMKILNDIKERRNTIHFQPVNLFRSSDIDQYKPLIEFVNKKVIKKHNFFVKKYRDKKYYRNFAEKLIPI